MGGRNFLIINCPPLARAPVYQLFRSQAQRDLATSLVKQWNTGLQSMISAMESAHVDVTMFYYDVWTTVNTVMDAPSTYPATAGYNDTTGYCQAYYEGTGGNQYYCNSTCAAGCVYNYLWIDFIHVTWPFHQVMANQLTTLLT